MSSNEQIPTGDAQDNDYVSRPGQKDGPIPVQSDDAPIESGVTGDSDEQLGIFPCSTIILLSFFGHNKG